MKTMKAYGFIAYESTRKNDIVKECRKQGIATKEEVTDIFKEINAGNIVFDVIAHNGKIYVISKCRNRYTLTYNA